MLDRKYILDFGASIAFAIGGSVAAAWTLGLHIDLERLTTPSRISQPSLALAAKPDHEVTQEEMRVGKVYLYLSDLDTGRLIQLKVMRDICRTHSFDCFGLNSAAVQKIMDGVLQERDETLKQRQIDAAERSAVASSKSSAAAERSADIANRSSIATLASVGISCLSLGLSLLGYLKKPEAQRPSVRNKDDGEEDASG